MSLELGAAVTVRVPATSANLGPGFDTLGLALGLYDEVTVEVIDGLRVDVEGEGAGEVSLDSDHLVVCALRSAFEAMEVKPAGLALSCRNRIPHGRGLGSSAAAIVAGVVAARALAEGSPDAVVLSDAAALDLAARIEGHADNVSACLLGGLTITWTDGERFRATGLRPAPGVHTVAFVPASKVRTRDARGHLPAAVPHSDAAANSGLTALLVHALTADPSLLLPATQDRLHQSYRSTVYPEAFDLVGILRADGVPAVISGSGPTVLALLPPGTEAPAAPPDWTACPLPVDLTGATVTRHAGNTSRRGRVAQG